MQTALLLSTLLLAPARGQHVYCQHRSYQDDSCSVLTTPSQGGLGTDQPTDVNPGIGIGTVVISQRIAPHSDHCLQVSNGQRLKGYYVDITGSFFRYIGAYHMTSDCSDTGEPFDYRADGTECSRTVGSKGYAAGVRG